jgi:SAM-dependent methyltransferase
MKLFGSLYSQYYDLLYQAKDYEAEVSFVVSTIKKNNSTYKTILDMGCGTGKHAELLSDEGFIVHGVDFSEDMLAVAETRRLGKKDKLYFTNNNILDLNLNKKFDVVVSLFHVFSYQTSNEDLVKAFESAMLHLNDDGLLIFDFWYGPAVLTDLPTSRIKQLENENIKVTRTAEPVISAQQNIVDVNYDILIEDKKSGRLSNKIEKHRMRYFFDMELELICKQLGFLIVEKKEWMTNKKPSFSSWNVGWVLKKSM